SNRADALARSNRGGRISRVRTRADGAGISVEISDTGPGVPAELAAKIFQPHFTTKAAGKGTGLGLDIVSRVVAHHHGTVTCESDATVARFVIRLPLAQPSAAPDGAS